VRPHVNDRLGFLSATGAVAAAIVLAVVALWSLVGGPVLFTPGALSAVAKSAPLGGVASHAQLTRCDACHAAPWSSKTMADLCMG
jgi:hypothetical protein